MESDKIEKIGVLGGSFDPIHFGHIHLAQRLIEAHGLDAIWFCPAWISPHKVDAPPVKAEARLKMVELALEDVPKCSVLDIEILKAKTSYTVDTLKTLLSDKAYGKKQFYLLIGDDMVNNFENWHNAREIVDLVPLLVGKRVHDVHYHLSDEKIKEALTKGTTKMPVLEISSIEIRDRLKKGLYCGYLLPNKVLEYIHKNKLYVV